MASADNLNYALGWAAWGLPVFLLRPGTKAPLKVKDPATGRYPPPREGGFHLATTDPDVIRHWWGKHPDANIGGRMGKESGVVAVDLPANPQLNGLVLPRAARVHRTPHGGRHLLYRHPGVHTPRDNSGKLAPGVDWQGDGSYIVLPRSRVEGGVYRAVRRSTKAELTDPEHLTALVQVGASVVEAVGEPQSRHLDDVTLAWKLVVNGVPGDVVLAALLSRDLGRDEPLQNIGRRKEIVAAVESAVRKLGEDPEAAEYEERLRRRRVDRRVTQTLNAEDLPPRVVLPEPGWSAVDELAVHREPPAPRIAGWCRAGANVLFSAREKSGKTTLGLNLARGLLDGAPFLGVYATQPYTGRLLYLNYEMSAELFDVWLHAVGIRALDRFVPLHLDGLALPFWLPDVRDELVAYCRATEAQGIILDAAAKAYLGLVNNENDNVQVSQFTQALNVVKRAAGVEDVFLFTHTAKNGNDDDDDSLEALTARGASAWGAWPDMIWAQVGRGDATRRIQPMGRLLPGEEALPPVALSLDRATWRLTTTGQRATDERALGLARDITLALVGVGADVLDGDAAPTDEQLDVGVKTKDLEALAAGRSVRKEKDFLAGLRKADEMGWLTRWFGSGVARGRRVPLYDSSNAKKVCFPTGAGAALGEKVKG
jgi:RecA-family ATPase